MRFSVHTGHDDVLSEDFPRGRSIVLGRPLRGLVPRPMVFLIILNAGSVLISELKRPNLLSVLAPSMGTCASCRSTTGSSILFTRPAFATCAGSGSRHCDRGIVPGL